MCFFAWILLLKFPLHLLRYTRSLYNNKIQDKIIVKSLCIYFVTVGSFSTYPQMGIKPMHAIKIRVLISWASKSRVWGLGCMVTLKMNSNTCLNTIKITKKWALSLKPKLLFYFMNCSY